jgi:hypothetical protein
MDEWIDRWLDRKKKGRVRYGDGAWLDGGIVQRKDGGTERWLTEGGIEGFRGTEGWKDGWRNGC